MSEGTQSQDHAKPAAAPHAVRRFYNWVDQNLEYWLMNTCYLVIVLIVFEEAVRRYIFKSQTPWSAQAAIYLFIWMSWIGCAFAVKKRAHIRFEEIRNRLPYRAQFALLIVDHICWVALSVIIFVYSVQSVLLQARLGSTVQGTDNFSLWIAFLGIPFGWSLVVWRTLQCAFEDYQNFRAKKSLVQSFTIEDIA